MNLQVLPINTIQLVRIGDTVAQTIFDTSSRTRNKIIRRMIKHEKLGCSRCGWSEASGDLHHIQGRKIDNPHDHSNLCYLCPNCHRMVHQGHIESSELKSLDDYIGDTWIKYYYSRKAEIKEHHRKNGTGIFASGPNNFKKMNDTRVANAKIRAKESIVKVLNSDIDFNKFGWVAKAAPLIGYSPQKVSWWMKKYMPEFYTECYIRKCNR